MRANTKTLLSTIVLLALLVGAARAATWSEQQKLTAADGAPGDYLGRSVAVSGDTALVGAAYDDDEGSRSGSVYVYTRSGGIWSEQQKLTAADGAVDDFLGYSVAVDGNTAVVGAYGDDDSGSYSGSAYVFVRSGGVWGEQQKLTASDGAADDRFGFSVAVSGDTAVVGAFGDDDNGSYSGSVYVYTRSGGVWSEQQKLTAADGATSDQFGRSVAVSGDTAVVGAQYDDDNDMQSGSAYVFVRSGGVWSQQQKLTAADGARNDQFGVSVAVNGDTAVVGTPYDDDNGSASGSAYVYTRSGGTWSEQQKLTASDGAANDYFGYSVAVDGDTAVVGAYWDDDNGADSGSAYVYTRSGGTWSEDAKLIASDGAANDYFGYNGAVSGDTVVVGAYLDDDNGADSGSAYVFLGIVGIVVDGLDTGDWGSISASITDPSGDETGGNDGQDITEVYAAYGDDDAYFRIDTVAAPAQAQIDFFVDNDTNTCAHGTGHSSSNVYDLHVQLTYSGGWLIQARQCSGSTWGGFSSVGSVAAVNIVEFSVPLATFGSTSGVSFFVRYGTTTDYAPDGDAATLVELVSFTAVQQAGGVQVAWQTASEVDNAGFNLYRQAAGGEYAKLNVALIPAQGGPTFGASYAYDDVDVIPGTTYAYMLEDVDVYGQTTMHGPVVVEVGEMPTAIEVYAFGASSAAAWLPTLALVFGVVGLAWTWRRKRR